MPIKHTFFQTQNIPECMFKLVCLTAVVHHMVISDVHICIFFPLQRDWQVSLICHNTERVQVPGPTRVEIAQVVKGEDEQTCKH